mgnify:CR=1 FL=1
MKVFAAIAGLLRDTQKFLALLLPAVAIGVEILFAYVFALGVTEFRLQRGAYPVLSEMRAAMSASDGVVGALPVLTSPRYLVPSLVAARRKLTPASGSWPTTRAPRSARRRASFTEGASRTSSVSGLNDSPHTATVLPPSPSCPGAAGTTSKLLGLISRCRMRDGSLRQENGAPQRSGRHWEIGAGLLTRAYI